MSVEPNQSMEDQLRAYAESRRLEAPPSFELDGLARRRLHDEVRNVYLSEPSPRKGGVTAWFWARLALVGASAALVLFVSVQFLPDNQPVLLGQKTDLDERSGRTTRSIAPVPAPTAARSPMVAEARGQTDATTAIAPGAGPSAAPMATDSFAADELVRPTDEPDVTVQIAPPDKAVAPQQPAAESLEFGVVDATRQPVVETLSVDQGFHQIQRYRRNPNSPVPPQVLQSFRWIREGDAVTVVDSDGSVYRGHMEANPAATEVSPRRFAVQASRESSVGERSRLQLQSLQAGMGGSMDGERFAVSGTNRTLNLLVEFEGVMGSQAAAPQTTTAAPATRMGQAKAAEEALQIQGQALVGPSTRLGIVAVPRVE